MYTGSDECLGGKLPSTTPKEVLITYYSPGSVCRACDFYLLKRCPGDSFCYNQNTKEYVSYRKGMEVKQ